jgi:hypothetical protein
MIFFVKHVPRFFRGHAPAKVRYGWILSVQRNDHVAIPLIAIDTTKSEVSVTVILGGPLPVSKRNIHGRRIMA